MSRIWFRSPGFHANLTSFLFLLDLKVGCTIITLFALFNKIAGIYGIIAIFQGGTFSQVSLYLYSIFTIFLFLWAIQGISDEDSQRVIKFAHLFLADHMLSSTWTLYFALDWFLYMKHDGERPKLNEYQEGLMGLIEKIESKYEKPGSKIHHQLLEGQARVDAAQMVWKGERAFSASVLCLGWLVKVSACEQNRRMQLTHRPCRSILPWSSTRMRSIYAMVPTESSLSPNPAGTIRQTETIALSGGSRLS